MPKLLVSLALTIATVAVFWQTGNNGFVIYDDPSYVIENPHVVSGLSLENVRWAFTAVHLSNWHPLTWISHMADCQLYGLNPRGHHFTSLALHLLSTLLLFLFFNRTTGALWQSAFVAALFALHPLHVESVAWVSERKDVLSAFFWMLTIWAYAGYAKSPRPARYMTVLLFFALGLLSKAMLITLPFVLLLLDYWPLGRLCAGRDAAAAGEGAARRHPAGLVVEKVPFLALAAASSIVTYLAQERGGSIAHDSSVAANFGNALITYLAYIREMIWPVDLAVFYPYNPGGVTPWGAAAAGCILAGVSLAAIRGARRRPWFLTGWFWYVGTLLPVIGIVRLGQHAMADRYTYIALIGLSVIAAWGAGDLARKLRWNSRALVVPAIAVLAACSALTWRQVGYWRDSITLFTHAVAVTDDNWLAYDNLSGAYVEQGNLEGALRAISASLGIRPDPTGYAHQGWIYTQLGDYGKSIDACRQAIMIDPGYGKAHFLLGRNYIYLKQYSGAVAEYRFLKRNGSGYAPELLEQLKTSGIDVSRTDADE